MHNMCKNVLYEYECVLRVMMHNMEELCKICVLIQNMSIAAPASPVNQQPVSATRQCAGCRQQEPSGGRGGVRRLPEGCNMSKTE